jgi:predicted O-methyltransferase YrrM
MRLDIVHPQVDEYLKRVLPPTPSVLREMEEEGNRRDFPIIGPLCGRLLAILALAVRARRVFEMGSGFGYSALWLAQAVGPRGTVILTEGSLENAETAKRYFTKAGLGGRARIYAGDAFEAFEREKGAFDFIFVDIEKRDYVEAYRRARARIRPGGILAFDNMLRDGRVAGVEQDPGTEGVRELTRLLYADERLETMIVPLRDGVSVSIARS